MMKNAFYFILKSFFVLDIFTFFVLTFLKIWLRNNYNTYIAQYLTK